MLRSLRGRRTDSSGTAGKDPSAPCDGACTVYASLTRHTAHTVSGRLLKHAIRFRALHRIVLNSPPEMLFFNGLLEKSSKGRGKTPSSGQPLDKSYCGQARSGVPGARDQLSVRMCSSYSTSKYSLCLASSWASPRNSSLTSRSSEAAARSLYNRNAAFSRFMAMTSASW